MKYFFIFLIYLGVFLMSIIKFYSILVLFVTLIRHRLHAVTINEVAYIGLWLILFYVNLILGREFNFNDGAGLYSKVVILGVVFFWLLIIHLSELKVFKNIILAYMLSINAYTFYLTFYTFFNDPLLFANRKFTSPFVEGIVATPAYGNSSSLLMVAAICFLEKKYQYIAFYSTLSLSLLLQNRTMMIITLFSYLFIFNNIRSRLYSFFVFIMIIIAASKFMSVEMVDSTLEVLLRRLENEGFSSERWDLALVAINDIFSVGHPYGGLDPSANSNYSYYFHNAIFDSYKNYGYLGLLFSSLIVLILLYQLIKLKFNKYYLLIFVSGVSVYLTSVVFEGAVFEVLVLQLVLSILFRKSILR
jgi:hypothetical protein